MCTKNNSMTSRNSGLVASRLLNTYLICPFFTFTQSSTPYTPAIMYHNFPYQPTSRHSTHSSKALYLAVLQFDYFSKKLILSRSECLLGTY